MLQNVAIFHPAVIVKHNSISAFKNNLIKTAYDA